MPIDFRCPLCDAPYRVKDEYAGKQASCKKCGGSLVVPQILPQFKMAIGQNATLVAAPNARPLSIADRQKAVLQGFEGGIQRVHSSWSYRLSILLVTLVMLILPVIYMGLIVLIGAGVVYHLTHHTGMLTAVRGRGAAIAVMAYLAPILIGGIAIIFMFKPLLARRANVRRSRSLTADGEPILFSFVERLAQVVGSPVPRRIEVDVDVNASAGFRRGWLSVVLGNDLTLTIGVPLLAGLTMRQFAGVLAHEFGHFSQGTGMRLSYVVRSISHWFTRVVYERDVWDLWLETITDDLDIRIAWVFFLTRGCVWVSRGVLWCLMYCGHAVAGVLLRQMEFDADRYEARVAGSDCFEQTTRRVHELSVASQKSFQDLFQLFQEGHLGDNFPKLVVFNSQIMPAKIKTEIHKSIFESSTELFDSHPCDKDRIANAHAEAAPGVFRIEKPAADLFVHFDALCKNVTADFYRDATGTLIDPRELHPIEGLLARIQSANA